MLGFATCDTAALKCVATADAGVDMASDAGVACTSDTQCTVATAPICDATKGTCGACSADKDCSGATGGPACATTGTNAGACVQCNEDADCIGTNLGDVCGADNTCVPCTANSQCSSTGICDLDIPTGGKCAPAFLYVDNINCPGAATQDGASDATAFCQVDDAITAKVVSGTKGYIKVMASTTPYHAITAPTSGKSSVSVLIVGPGKAAALETPSKGAQVESLGTPAVSVGPPATVTLSVAVDGLELIGASDSGGRAGATCTGVTGTASLTVRDSYIHGSGAEGVNASSCAITLESNLIKANATGCIVVTGGSYTIDSNFLIGGAATTFAPIRLDETSSGKFAFNTVALNVTTGTAVGGVSCGGTTPKTIDSSIFYGNTKLSGTQFTSACTLTNVVADAEATTSGVMVATPTFTDPTSDFHLTAGASANATCCFNHATVDATVKRDVDNQLRPIGPGYDIGADEVQ